MSCGSSKLQLSLGRAGSASLETALVLLAFLTLLFGAMDLGRYLLTIQSMQTLLGMAQRAAVVGNYSIGSTGDCPLVSSISTSMPFTPPPFLDPTTTLCVISTANSGSGTLVTIQVSSAFTSYTPGLSALTGTLNESAQVAY